MGYYIVGGCIAIYVGAYLLRLFVKGYAMLTGATPAAHNVRYATIGAATVLLILATVIGESRLNAPDYSYLWTYVVSGVIVFTASVGRSYWWWRKVQRSGFEGSGKLAGFDPWGYERPRAPERGENSESTLEESISIIAFALIAAAAVATTSYDVDPDAVIGLLLAPVLWLGEGFVTAMTNPYYISGLLIGIGTGWIARGAVSK
jgi:hypothetical protein